MGNSYSSHSERQQKQLQPPPGRTASPSRVRRYIESSFDVVDLEDLLQTLSLEDAKDLQSLLSTRSIDDPSIAVNAPYKVSRVLLPDGKEYLIPSKDIDVFVRKVETRRSSSYLGVDTERRMISFSQAFDQNQRLKGQYDKEMKMLKEIEERRRLFEEEQKRATGLEKAPPIKQSTFKGECFDFLVEFGEVSIREFLNRDRENIVIVTVTPGKEEATATCASKEYLRTYKRQYEGLNYVKIPAIVAGGGDVFVSRQNLDDAIRFDVRVICIVPTGKTINQRSESEPLFVFKRCDFLAN